jgi:hypothetical protein
LVKVATALLAALGAAALLPVAPAQESGPPRPDARRWYVFPGPKPTVYTGRGSAADVSFLQDAPAGRHGFLGVRDGHLAFKDGTRARFWGVNIAGANVFVDHVTAVRVATRLSAAGVNLVRLTRLDAPGAGLFDESTEDTQHLSRQGLENLDFLIAELKKRGIYVYLDLLSDRRFRTLDGVADYERLGQGGRAAVCFNRRLQDQQKELAKRLLTHVNRYTDQPYAEEPALALLDLVNESSLLAPECLESLPPPYAEELRRLFEGWCAANTVKAPPGEVATLLRAGNRPALRFLAAQQETYYRDASSYLRGIGIKVPITGSSYWGTPAADLLSLAGTDFVDRHGYWRSPQGGYSPVGPPATTPMVDAPLGSLPELGRQRILGKPFLVSAWGRDPADGMAADSPLLMAAYAALQDWDGVLQYDYSGPDWSPRMTGLLDLGDKPQLWAQYPAAALLFRRGDVSKARELFLGSLTADEVWAGAAPDAKVPPGTALRRRVATYLEGAGPKPASAPARAESANAQLFVSDTDQLRWQATPGLFTLSSPESVAAVGHAESPVLELGEVTFRLRTSFASVSLVSLDRKPLGQSRRMLLTAVSRAQNGEPAGARDPSSIRVEPVQGEITLKRAANAPRLEVYTLDPWGGRRERLPQLSEGAVLRLRLTGEPALWYELVAAEGAP